MRFENRPIHASIARSWLPLFNVVSPQHLAHNDVQINYEAFGTWLSSGLDPDRLASKLGRLLGQLTGRTPYRGDHGGGSDGGKAAKDRAKTRKRLLKGGVRGLFEEIDHKATGAVSRHDMKVILVFVTTVFQVMQYLHAFHVGGGQQDFGYGVHNPGQIFRDEA